GWRLRSSSLVVFSESKGGTSGERWVSAKVAVGNLLLPSSSAAMVVVKVEIAVCNPAPLGDGSRRLT
ncbi:hypothetical protein Dimus_021076, partial [Dionaea muscipula]